MAAEEWQSVPLLDEEWLKVMTALIPDVEQFFACRGLSLEKYRVLDDMDLVVKLQTEMIADLREQQREKGYIEMEVTDEEDEGGGGRATYGRGRRRFRPGVCKKPSGEIKKLSFP
jgi:hypothetical protein